MLRSFYAFLTNLVLLFGRYFLLNKSICAVIQSEKEALEQERDELKQAVELAEKGKHQLMSQVKLIEIFRLRLHRASIES